MSRDEWLHQIAPATDVALDWVDSGEAFLEAQIQSAHTTMEQQLVSDPASFQGEGMSQGDQEVLARPRS